MPHPLLAHFGSIKELHYVSIVPGATRGNHAHLGRDEIILVAYRDTWELHWQEQNGPTQSLFKGSGATTVHVSAGVLHALKNTGCHDLHVVSISNGAPIKGDTFWETLTS